jgi:hypothetical protein
MTCAGTIVSQSERHSEGVRMESGNKVSGDVGSMPPRNLRRVSGGTRTAGRCVRSDRSRNGDLGVVEGGVAQAEAKLVTRRNVFLRDR